MTDVNNPFVKPMDVDKVKDLFAIPSSEPATGGPSGGLVGDQNANEKTKSHLLVEASLPESGEVVNDDHTEIEEGEKVVYKTKSNYSQQNLNDLHDKVITIMDNRPESEIPLADPYWAANNAYRQALKAAGIL